jgi:hypothetical protein
VKTYSGRGYIKLVGNRGSSKNIADFLHCLSFLENKTSTLYKKLSKKTVNIMFSDGFLKISQNTKKHSEILDEIATKISRPRIGDRECAKRLATVCNSIEKVSKEIKHKKLLSLKELSEIISILEGSLGEESYMTIQAKTFLAMAPQICRLYGVHLENFKKLLYSIVAHEEAHVEILENIKAAIDKKIGKEEGSAPIVKYKNPDSWIVSV